MLGWSSAAAALASRRKRCLSSSLSKELERDGAFEVGVLGLVDHTHATLAELLDDLVVADAGADVQDRGIVSLCDG